jgi:multiple sugar transport system ATP-binding protein
MAGLELNSLRKEYGNGNILAVDDLGLDIADGEFVTVVGPSGCGKTTTLRMIAGLETPTSGSVYIGRRNVTDVHAKNRDVAMVFQNYALYPHKTVRQNMAFGLRMSTDLDAEEREEKIRWATDMMGIEDLLDSTPDELSGGQKQRVALGRAIVREPDVFLFDEPLSNLDAKLRTSMRTEIQRLQNELDITSVYVTHDQEEAMTMGDRIVILNEGKLQQVGEPTDVYDEPVNRFVAGFIGSPSMNFVDVLATDEGDSARLADVDEAFAYRLSSARTGDVDDGSRYTLGIRPEDVSVADGPGESAVPAVVEVVEPIGSDNYLYVNLGEDAGIDLGSRSEEKGEFVARVAADVEPNVGDRLFLYFDESNVRLFDAETGDAVLARERRVPSSACG